MFGETISIDAPPATVFGVITDLASYASWNPWIVRASGVADEGSVIRVTSRLGPRRIQVRHRILTRREGVEFRWCDLGWFTVLARGERARYLESTSEGGTRYRVELTITGVARRFVLRKFGGALAAGLSAETVSLKERAETVHRLQREAQVAQAGG